MIFAQAFVPAPMRCPNEVWAMLVSAVDILGDADADRPGEVALLAGSWVPEQPPADMYDGDLDVRLIPRTIARDNTPMWPDVSADIEMLLAHQGHWQLVGRWCVLDNRWPRIIAPTVAAVMSLHNDAAEEPRGSRLLPLR